MVGCVFGIIEICMLDSSSQNSLTSCVVAGSSQNQCEVLVEIVNLLLPVRPEPRDDNPLYILKKGVRTNTTENIARELVLVLRRNSNNNTCQ